jgi:hypothetical protein
MKLEYRQNGKFDLLLSHWNADKEKYEKKSGTYECLGGLCKMSIGVLAGGDSRIVAVEYDNYALFYHCESIAGVVKDWGVWIVARTPTISDSLILRIEDIIGEQMPKYDITYLEKTKQGGDCREKNKDYGISDYSQIYQTH